MPSPEGSENLEITFPDSLNWRLRNQVPLKRRGLFTTSQSEICQKTRCFSTTVVRRDEFSAYPYILSILILSLHLRLDLRSGLSPGFFRFVFKLRLQFNISDVTVPNDSANTDAINLHESSKAQWLLYVLQGFSCSWLDGSTGPRPLYRLGFEVTLRYTKIGRTPLDEWSALAGTSTWQHTQHSKQTPMSPTRNEPASPASERPQTQAFDRADTGIGWKQV